MWEDLCPQSHVSCQGITSQITGGSDRNLAKFQFPLSEGYSSTLKQQLSLARDVSSN